MTGLIPSIRKFAKKNSVNILTGLASGGVIATAVSAAKATPKALEAIKNDSKKKHGNENDYTKLEAIQSGWASYIPTALIVGGTIGCIFGMNGLSRRKQATLLGAYSLVDQSYKNYRNKLIELHGPDADREVRDAIIREHCSYHLVDSDIPEGKLCFYEPYSGETFYRYEREVIDAEYHFNRNYTMRGYASYSEWRSFLGLEYDPKYDEVGWSMAGGICWIDFEHHLVTDNDDGGEPIYSIEFVFGDPEPGYLDDWE